MFSVGQISNIYVTLIRLPYFVYSKVLGTNYRLIYVVLCLKSISPISDDIKSNFNVSQTVIANLMSPCFLSI